MNAPVRRFIVSAGLALALSCTAMNASPDFSKFSRRSKTPPPPPPVATLHASAQLSDKKLNARVDALLGQMTLEEKIGQLVQYTSGSTITGPAGEKLDYDAMLAKGQIGSLFNVVGAEATNHYQHIAVEKSRLHIPLLFGLDVIHGHRTTFPVPLAMASSFDPSIVEQASHMAAVESRQDGINWVFSPMVDIARDARWGRIVESAGE
ncbi:MAG: beta-glucosidase, partial [Acidobacteriaceae bacterium]|nr:beta-glucosidase [Acidobacteriaceae bacterium]